MDHLELILIVLVITLLDAISQIIPKSGSVFYKQWRASWNHIFKTYTKTKFNIMVPPKA